MTERHAAPDGPLPPRWETEIEMRLGDRVRHGWVDHRDDLRTGCAVRIEGETEWWIVVQVFGRRENAICIGAPAVVAEVAAES